MNVPTLNRGCFTVANIRRDTTYRNVELYLYYRFCYVLYKAKEFSIYQAQLRYIIHKYTAIYPTRSLPLHFTIFVEATRLPRDVDDILPGLLVCNCSLCEEHLSSTSWLPILPPRPLL